MKTELVVIPRDYEDGRSKGIIPICVSLSDEDGPVADKQGRPLDPEWVVRVVEPICCRMVRVARYYLGDAWRASELADRVIHGAWRRNGPECGDNASQKILGTAVWVARAIRAGDDLRRKKPGLFLAIDMMDSKVRDQLLIDPRDYVAEVEQQLTLEAVEASLRSGSESSEFAETFAKVFHLLCAGVSWATIERLIPIEGCAFRKRFYRFARARVAKKKTCAKVVAG